jgi:hypothetical protein
MSRYKFESLLCTIGVFAIVIAGACSALKFLWDILNALFQFYN